jgi:FkbM family methyltransferase
VGHRAVCDDRPTADEMMATEDSLSTKVSRRVTRWLTSTTPREGLVRLGTDYGGWWVAPDALDRASICYCAGLGEDASFDQALLTTTGCQVWAFDPTPRAATYARSITDPRFHFEPVGIWSETREMEFFAPRDPAHVSYSIGSIQGTTESFRAKCESLPDVMARLGHGRIDLLKLNIEGAEAAVLEAMLRSSIRPTQICVAFEAIEMPWRTRRRIKDLQTAGYTVAHSEGYSYLFVR